MRGATRPVSQRGRTWPVLVLLALTLVAMRWHTYDEPFERDLDIYALIGHELLNGRSLYTDLIDIKPPAPFLTYAAAEIVVGFGPQQMFLLGVCSALLTLAGLYWLFARSLRRPGVGLFAAALWVLSGSDLHLQANQANTEAFLNAGMVWGIALMVTSAGERIGPARLALLGSVLAWITLYKHVMLVPVALILAVHVAVPPSRDGRRRALLEASILGGIVAGFWVTVFAYFAWRGAFQEFWDTMVTFGRQYVELRGRSAWGNIVEGLHLHRLFPPEIRFFFLSLGIPTLLAIPAGLKLGPRRVWCLLIAWLVGTQLAISLPGQFFVHYYQLWLPPLVVGAGLIVMLLLDRLPRGRSPAVAVVVVAGCALLSLRALPQYRHDAEEWSRMKYGPRFAEARRLGERIGAWLEPDEGVFVWGVLPGIYRASGRRQPTGIANVWLTLPWYGGPLSERLTERLSTELDAAAPDLIVVDPATWKRTAAEHPIRRRIEARYELLPFRCAFPLLAKKSSALLQRAAETELDCRPTSAP